MHELIKRSLCAVATTLVCTAACASPLDSYLRAKDTVVFVGDSLTARSDYPVQIEKAIAAVYPEDGLKVVRAAAENTPIASFRTPIEAALEDNPASVAVIMLGLDEIEHASDERKEARRRDLQGLINGCRSKGLDVILVQPPWLEAAAPSHDTGKRYREYTSIAATITEVARQMRTPLINVHRAYADALAEARTADPEYAFAATPSTLYASGSAVIAAEIIRALGIGLPLAKADRGPVRARSSPGVTVRIRPVSGTADVPGRIPLIVAVANHGDSPVSGIVEIAAGGGLARQPISNLAGSEERTLRIDLPTTALAGRAAVDPIRATLRTPAGIAGAESTFQHSRIVDLSKIQYAAGEGAFALRAGDLETPCPVRFASVTATEESIVFKVAVDDWTDAPVNATKRPAPLGRLRGINYDAVILLLDLRLPDAAGRSTMNASLADQDIMRVIITQWGEDPETIKMFALPGYLEQFVELKATSAGKFEVEIKARLRGRSFGFDIVGFNSPAIDQPAAAYNVADGPLGDPAGFIRASANEDGVFYRVGF